MISSNKDQQELFHTKNINGEEASKAIRGKIVNSKDKTIVLGATIHIWSSVSKTSVKKNGEFYLEVPSFFQSDSVLLEIRHTIYESRMISCDLKNPNSFLVLEIDPIKKKGESKKRGWNIFRR